MNLGNFSLSPGGMISFLDTDLCKLTVHCAVLKYFADVIVSYNFMNRTPEKKLSRAGFRWLQAQIDKIVLSDDELYFLQRNCSYLNEPYLKFLKTFRLHPQDQVIVSFVPDNDTSGENDLGEIILEVRGLWTDTILYEIPVLAFASEAYFRFVDTDWKYAKQEENAYQKGMRLLEAGCVFAEYGTRRRRDYHTQELVLRGLKRAKQDGEQICLPGKISGTSNVHLAMRFGFAPIGTIGHEWFMGIAAITGNYKTSLATALSYWLDFFGEGVLGIVPTDVFGTPIFLKSLQKTVQLRKDTSMTNNSGHTETKDDPKQRTFAEVFTSLRQDSGDPSKFVKAIQAFYSNEGIKDKKTIVFSDSLNIDLCLEYKKFAEEVGFRCTFGIGTCFTNDFIYQSTISNVQELPTPVEKGRKYTPLNIVIKLSSAADNAAIKISDSIGKNTGDKATIERVKKELGYVEDDWNGGG